MAEWLTVEDLRVHLSLPTDAFPDDSDQEKRAQDALNATMELIDSTTGKAWGEETSLPSRVKEAGLLQAGRLFKRQTAPLGIAAVGTGDGGSGMRLLAKLDPDVELLLGAWADYSSL
jgi:hypothetical protein